MGARAKRWSVGFVAATLTAVVLAAGAADASEPIRLAQSAPASELLDTEVSEPLADVGGPDAGAASEPLQSPDVSAPVEARPVPDIDAPEPAPCAAIAVDAPSGALGNGLGETLAAAEEDARQACEAQGGTVCSVTSSACSPDGEGG